VAEWLPNDVRDLAPEFVGLTDPQIQAWIDRAYPQINPDAFGDSTVYAGALLTAHLLTIFPPAGVTVAPGAPGPISSETVGQISVSYAVPPVKTRAALTGTLGQSRYGIEFSRLLELTGYSPQVL
jgi:hypothetical protein